MLWCRVGLSPHKWSRSLTHVPKTEVKTKLAATTDDLFAYVILRNARIESEPSEDDAFRPFHVFRMWELRIERKKPSNEVRQSA